MLNLLLLNYIPWHYTIFFPSSYLFYKTHQWPQDWERSVFIPIRKEGNTKECSKYRTIAVISHASKVILKILQASLQQYVNQEIPDVQSGFRKGRGSRDQIVNICWIIKKVREFQTVFKCYPHLQWNTKIYWVFTKHWPQCTLVVKIMDSEGHCLRSSPGLTCL